MEQKDNRYRPSDSAASAIRRFLELWKRKAVQDNEDKRREQGWRKAEVYGLWAAAAVGVVAIIVSSVDSHHQKEVMKGQLDEMRAEQRPNLWVLSDLGAPIYSPSGGGQIVWTVQLTNYGKSFVARGTIHKFMRLGDNGFLPSYGEPKDVNITPVAPGQIITYSVVSDPGVAPALNSLLAKTGGIQIKLVMEYQDLAGGSYRSTLQLSRTNAGSIAFDPESRIER